MPNFDETVVDSNDFYSFLERKNVKNVDVCFMFGNGASKKGSVDVGYKNPADDLGKEVTSELIRFAGGLITQNIIGAVGTTTTWTACGWSMKVIRLEVREVVLIMTKSKQEVTDCSGDPM